MTKRDILRKLLLILIAAINSEILSTSQTFRTLFLNPLLLAIYFFSFIMMDELVQRYNFGNKDIFYMGSIFGLVLEGFVAFTPVADPLAPFVMIPFAILWHGLITTLVSFTVVEVVIPRREKEISKIWMIWGSVFWIILLFMTIRDNFTIVVSHLFVYLTIIILILVFLFLIKKSLRNPVIYRPKIILSIILIIFGFAIGLLVNRNTFSFINYFLMLIFYVIIIILLLKKREEFQSKVHLPY